MVAVPASTMEGLLLLAGLVVASGVAGCKGDECARGQFRCVGNAAEYCGEEDSDDPNLVWHRHDCGTAYCRPVREPNGAYPVCALTPDPDPRCAGGDQVRFCDGNVVDTCSMGYVITTTDCTTGSYTGDSLYRAVPSTGFCASSMNRAVCAMDSAPNPLCGPLPSGSGRVCDGNRLLSCDIGYVIEEVACPSAGACVSTPIAFCSATAAPDPVCLASDASERTCKNGQIAACIYGYVQSVETCAPGTICQFDQDPPHAPYCLPN